MSEVETYNNCTCESQTPMAIKVKIPGEGSWWVPKSVVDDDSEVYETGGTGKLIIKRWWAEKNNLC